VRRAAVAAAIAAASAAGLLAGCGGPDTPNLTANNDEGLAFPVRVGKPFGFGLPVLTNRSSEPLTLESASLEGRGKDLDVLNTQAAGASRRFDFVANSLQVPYMTRNQHPRPLAGAIVPPAHAQAGRRGIEVILTMRAPAKGVYFFDNLRVDFTQGGDHFTRTFAYPVRICATPSRLEKHCPIPKAPS
jgi:hypothetical protein